MCWKSFLLDTNFFVFSQLGGSVIKYSESNTRKHWLKETPETLLNILKNADLSLAFQTYTIYRPGAEGFFLLLLLFFIFFYL